MAAGTVQRVAWPASRGTPDIPFYVNEIPTIQVAVNQPVALADVPQVQTQINAYDDKDFNLEILLEKLVQGPEAFKDVDSVDSFTSFEDTHYSSADVYADRVNLAKTKLESVEMRDICFLYNSFSLLGFVSLQNSQSKIFKTG